jgi:hypothetical protein
MPGSDPNLMSASNVAAPTQRATDPINDVQCWAEHKSEHGRRYWYNVVTQQSTYDKPFCLKTPEERAIPPCIWKEYVSAEGKIYYNNGTESKWDVPEEFRIWKEKVEAAEKRLPSSSSSHTNASLSHTSSSTNLNTSAGHAGNATLSRSSSSMNMAAGGNHNNATGNAVAKVVYASAAEAMEAFKDLLQQQQISSAAKFKEVQDLCGHDPRWEALKTQGEKRQALAEYQTKRLKQEKEESKVKAKKHREAFLRMLAEHTDIDVRTRWRQAQEMLREDIRFKNVDDAREREDLFQEFINELEKKEKEDRQRQKDRAMQILLELFQRMREPANNSLVLHAQSTWSEHKETLLSLLQRPDLRVMDETDMRRAFQDFVTRLQQEAKLEERRRREEWQQQVESNERDCLSFLVEQTLLGHFLLPGWADAPIVSSSSSSGANGPYHLRYKEIMQHDHFTSHCPAYPRLQALYQDATAYGHVLKETMVPGSEALNRRLHQLYDRWCESMQESYRSDKKLVKKACSIVLHPQWKPGMTSVPEGGSLPSSLSSSSHHHHHQHHYHHHHPHHHHYNAHRIEHDTSVPDVFQRLIEFANLPDDGASSPSSPSEARDHHGSTSTSNINSNSNGGRGVGSWPAVSDIGGWKQYVAEHWSVVPTNGDPSSDETSSHPTPTPTNSNNTAGGVVVSPTSLRKLLQTRPWIVRFILDEQSARAKEDYEEEMRYRKKAEDKFVQLLKDAVYLSDHLRYTWEDVKPMIQHRSAYEALTKSDRRRVFAQYMQELSEKYAAKSQAMKLLSLQHQHQQQEVQQQQQQQQQQPQQQPQQLLQPQREMLVGKKRERSESPLPTAQRPRHSTASSSSKATKDTDEPEEGEEREEGEAVE